MSEIVGKSVPEFKAACTGAPFVLSALRGKAVVLYFYPKDDTPGCTSEGADFRDQYAQFQSANTEIFGISRDGLKSHQKFKDKMAFPFQLIADEDESVCQLFNVIKMKNMYGKQVRGIERSTFVIDAQGVLKREWRGVKVPGHVAEVLEFVRSIT
ncbi:MAG: peroxiredoxin [Burkholderiaceae bacterium]|nr:MAG: peroxiredoxin [Burkholderiaceae bacterium]